MRPLEEAIARPGGRPDARQLGVPATGPRIFSCRRACCPMVVRCEPGVAIRAVTEHSDAARRPPIGVPSPVAMSNAVPDGYRPPLDEVMSLLHEVISLKVEPYALPAAR